MGGETSSLIPKPMGFDYLSITLRVTDRIRLIYADEREISCVREAVLQHWKKGIQEELSKFGAHEFKIKGNPFGFSLADDAAASRYMACNILFRLYNAGCKLLVSSDLSRLSDLTTWFFHREEVTPLQVDIACIGISSYDKLQFINFPQPIMQTFESVVKQVWPKEIQKVKYIGECLQIKLRGTPWGYASASESIQAKTMIKALINHLSMHQWGLYGSSNLKSTADTLFFKYDPSQPIDGSLATGFVISLNRNDRLRCIDAPADVPTAVKNAISEGWLRGIQDEKLKFNSYEFKLSGYPWWANGTDAICSRMLMCKILERLMSIGWKVQMAIDLSRKDNDKSVLMFQRCPPGNVSIFCLSLNETDKVRFINAPPNVTTALRDEVIRTWLFGVKKERTDQGCHELKLNKNPWNYGMNGHDGAHGRVMLSYLIKLLAQMGWFLILSADISAKYVSQENGPDYPLDVHSMWFMYLGFGVAPAPQTAPPPMAAAQFGMAGQPGFVPPAPTQYGMAGQSNLAPSVPPQYGMAQPVSNPQEAPPQYGLDGQSGMKFESAFTYGPAT